MNTSILGVQWISRAQLIFLRNLFLWNFCRTWAEQYWAFGRKIWGRFSEATCYWASEIFRGMNFWKTVNFGNFCGGRDKYLQSFDKNFLTVLSKMHSIFRKDFFEENHTFWKKNIFYEVFGSLSEKSHFCRVFFSRVVKIGTYFCRITSRGKRFFWRK